MCRYQYAWLNFLQGNIDETKVQLNNILNDTIFKELAHIFQAEILDFIENDISVAIDSYLDFSIALQVELDLWKQECLDHPNSYLM